MSGPHVLVVRPDSLGDVLVCGPAVRAVAAGARRVTVLAGPRGVAAARLLPGVDQVLERELPWIARPAPPVRRADVLALADDLAAPQVDEALVLTSFHQSALPTALVLRLAGIGRIAAISEDYPGSLLDVRIAPPPDDPEPLRMLAAARAAGYDLPPGDDARLRVTGAAASPWPAPYTVVHPGADAAARRYPWFPEVVAGLTAAGGTVLVTGTADEAALTAGAAAAARRPGRAHDLAGRLSLAGLAGVLAGAGAVVVGNTGPAHLAAAVGTPVVSLFAPVVPSRRWAPWGVPVALLGDQHEACAGTRAVDCPLAGHPCLAGVDPAEVVAAAHELTGAAARREGAGVR